HPTGPTLFPSPTLCRSHGPCEVADFVAQRLHLGRELEQRGHRRFVEGTQVGEGRGVRYGGGGGRDHGSRLSVVTDEGEKMRWWRPEEHTSELQSRAHLV